MFKSSIVFFVHGNFVERRAKLSADSAQLRSRSCSSPTVAETALLCSGPELWSDPGFREEHSATRSAVS